MNRQNTEPASKLSLWRYLWAFLAAVLAAGITYAFLHALYDVVVVDPEHRGFWYRLNYMLGLFPIILLAIFAQAVVISAPLIALLNYFRLRALSTAIIVGALSAFLPWLPTGSLAALVLLIPGANAGATFWAIAWRKR